MNQHDNTWERLLATARRAPARPVDAPHGFSTRVVTTWAARRRQEPTAVALEWLSLRALCAAATLVVAAAVFAYANADSGSLLAPTEADPVLALLAEL